MASNYYRRLGRKRGKRRFVLLAGTALLVVAIVIMRLRTLEKMYYRSMVALPVPERTNVDAVRKWAQIVVREGHPQDVFELVPNLPRAIHNDVTYVTVQWQEPRYIWATDTEAGITHLHPSVWGEVIGAVEWPEEIEK